MSTERSGRLCFIDKETAYRNERAYQRSIERKEQVVVGVNSFMAHEELSLERLAVDPTIEQNQRASLADLRATRDNAKVSELLTRLEAASKTSENLMPLFVECVENWITLGEINGVLRRAWGEYVAASWA